MRDDCFPQAAASDRKLLRGSRPLNCLRPSAASWSATKSDSIHRQASSTSVARCSVLAAHSRLVRAGVWGVVEGMLVLVVRFYHGPEGLFLAHGLDQGPMANALIQGLHRGAVARALVQV